MAALAVEATAAVVEAEEEEKEGETGIEVAAEREAVVRETKVVEEGEGTMLTTQTIIAMKKEDKRRTIIRDETIGIAAITRTKTKSLPHKFQKKKSSDWQRKRDLLRKPKRNGNE